MPITTMSPPPAACEVLAEIQQDIRRRRRIGQGPEATPPSTVRETSDDRRNQVAESFAMLAYGVELMEMRVTLEQPILAVSGSPGPISPLAFAQSVFPNSRNMTAAEHREFEEIVFAHGKPTGRRRLRSI